MTRRFIRLAVVAFIAPLATACGGGGSHMVPATVPQQANSAAVSVPQTAAKGVLVTVHLPLRNSSQLDALIARQGDQSSSDYHRFLTPAQFRTTYAPSAADLNAAATAMKNLGFTTLTTSQSVLAVAPQATVESAFGVKLAAVQARGRTASSASRTTVLAANRAPVLPSALTSVGATVGFSPYVHESTPAASRRRRSRRRRTTATRPPDRTGSPTSSRPTGTRRTRR